MKVMIIEFITSIGGVQTVYRNVLPFLSKTNDIYFLDPYNHEYDSVITEGTCVNTINLPLKIPRSLGWNNGVINRFIVLGKHGFSFLRYSFRLAKLVKDRRIDIIYVSGKKEVTLAFILSALTRTKYIYHAHGFSSSSDIGLLFRTAISNAKKIICVSNHVKSTLLGAGIDESKLCVVYNGIVFPSENLQDISQKHVYKDQRLRLGFIGSIHSKKNPLILVNAVGELINEGLDLELTIIGEPPSGSDTVYFDKLQSRMKHYGETHFRYLGYIDNVHGAINEFDVLVLPSTEESFGMVIIEAMYNSTPVIGSDIGGIPEVIDNEVTGLLFRNEDICDLKKKIRQVYFDRALIISYGKNGHDRVVKLFDSRIQAKSIDDILKDVYENDQD